MPDEPGGELVADVVGHAQPSQFSEGEVGFLRGPLRGPVPGAGLFDQPGRLGEVVVGEFAAGAVQLGKGPTGRRV